MTRSRALVLLEGLWLARTPAQRRAFAHHHLGDSVDGEVVERMQTLLAFVAGLAGNDPSNPSWRRLEQVSTWLAGGTTGTEPTLRSAEVLVPTLPADTEPSPPLWPLLEPAGIGVESALSAAVGTIIKQVVSDVADETLLGGSAPVTPFTLVCALLDQGDATRALDIYAALCAETEAAPPRRPRIHSLFGLSTEAQRRALDHRFESLFDRDPGLREVFSARVARLTEELARRSAP